ncbi:molybdenum cofactor guanylyltransferase [Aestuariivirga sp.]|uniref:molybdenum cofactor guanylyltransferase n=1 Tax=Aestuariivirga sp. TaxID=2650926 RepID=UPI0039E2985A
MKIAAVIIAGGASSRMGAEKLLLPVGQRRIIDRLLSILPQPVALNANGDPARFAGVSLPVIADSMKDIGTPLAGLHAALLWGEAQDVDAVLTVPSDCPFLPSDLAARLSAAGAPAVAASGGAVHYLTGLWPVTARASLESLTARGVRRVRDWVEAVDARTVEWDARPFDPFMNVNTPEELAEANRIASLSG